MKDKRCSWKPHALRKYSRSFIATICLFAGSVVTQAQPVAIGNELLNALVLAEDNPLEVAVAGRSCKEFAVESEHVIIKKVGDCRYSARPDSGCPPVVSITIRERTSRKILETRKFRTTFHPGIIAGPCSWAPGKLRLRVLHECAGLETTIVNLDYLVPVAVASFAVIILRKDGRYDELVQPAGAAFTEAMRAAFLELQPGDRLIFRSVRGIWETGQIRDLPMTEYEMQ